MNECLRKRVYMRLMGHAYDLEPTTYIYIYIEREINHIDVGLPSWMRTQRRWMFCGAANRRALDA